MPGHCRPAPSDPTDPHGPTPGVADDRPLCSRCDAVCCRLTVVLQEGDRIASHLTTHTEAGLHVMARDEDGWCVALDSVHMRCSIYEHRPAVCRRFEMGGPYCLAIREDYRRHGPGAVPDTDHATDTDSKT